VGGGDRNAGLSLPGLAAREEPDLASLRGSPFQAEDEVGVLLLADQLAPAGARDGLEHFPPHGPALGGVARHLPASEVLAVEQRYEPLLDLGLLLRRGVL